MQQSHTERDIIFDSVLYSACCLSIVLGALYIIAMAALMPGAVLVGIPVFFIAIYLSGNIYTSNLRNVANVDSVVKEETLPSPIASPSSEADGNCTKTGSSNLLSRIKGYNFFSQGNSSEGSVENKSTYEKRDGSNSACFG